MPSGRSVERRGGRAFAVAFFAVLLLVLVGVYLAGYYLTRDRVPRNSHVVGVDIGGLSPTTAQNKLARELGARAGKPITLVVRQSPRRTYTLDPAGAGLRFDAEATVDAAGGGSSLNPLRMWHVLTGGGPVEPVIEEDPAALRDAMTDVAAEVDRQPVGGSIGFTDARPDPTYPESGVEVDVEAATEVVQETVLAQDRSVRLPVDTLRAPVRPEDVDEALAEFARPAVSAPVTVQAAGEEVQLSPRSYAPALSMQVQSGSLRPEIDEKLLRERVRGALAPLSEPARNAAVRLRGGEPTVVAGEAGTRVPTDGLAEALLPVLTATGDDRVLELTSEVAKPSFTTQEAKDLRINEVVSSFTTSFPHSESNYRNVNLGRAAEKINGTVLKPGDVFSLNGIVGERTAANGFTTGTVIEGGRLVESLGGGVSQVATTVYNAAFFAGLEDVEHHPHSLYFDRYPKGREATVYWGALDLRFRNNTPYGVLVEAWIVPATPGTDGEMHVRMWSTQHYDRVEAGLSEEYDHTEPEVRYVTEDDCTPMSGSPGFEVDVVRRLYRDGEQVDGRTWHVTYEPHDTVYCYARP